MPSNTPLFKKFHLVSAEQNMGESVLLNMQVNVTKSDFY